MPPLESSSLPHSTVPTGIWLASALEYPVGSGRASAAGAEQLCPGLGHGCMAPGTAPTSSPSPGSHDTNLSPAPAGHWVPPAWQWLRHLPWAVRSPWHRQRCPHTPPQHSDLREDRGTGRAISGWKPPSHGPHGDGVFPSPRCQVSHQDGQETGVMESLKGAVAPFEVGVTSGFRPPPVSFPCPMAPTQRPAPRHGPCLHSPSQALDSTQAAALKSEAVPP